MGKETFIWWWETIGQFHSPSCEVHSTIFAVCCLENVDWLEHLAARATLHQFCQQCIDRYRLACSRLSWIWSIRAHKLSLRKEKWVRGCGAENIWKHNMKTWTFPLPGYAAPPHHRATAPPRLRVCSKDAPVATHRVSKRNVFWKNGGRSHVCFQVCLRSVSWHCDIQFFNLCWEASHFYGNKKRYNWVHSEPATGGFYMFLLCMPHALCHPWDATHDSKFPTRRLHKQWFHLRWQV